MALEHELETYKQKLPELKGNEGKYALIHGESLELFSSYDDALKAGYQQYGLENPFMVKQIQAIEQVQFISRLVVTCP